MTLPALPPRLKTARPSVELKSGSANPSFSIYYRFAKSMSPARTTTVSCSCQTQAFHAIAPSPDSRWPYIGHHTANYLPVTPAAQRSGVMSRRVSGGGYLLASISPPSRCCRVELKYHDCGITIITVQVLLGHLPTNRRCGWRVQLNQMLHRRHKDTNAVRGIHNNRKIRYTTKC